MNISATAVVQLIALIAFVWFCSTYVLPPLLTALEQRKETIARELAKAERTLGEREDDEAKARFRSKL